MPLRRRAADADRHTFELVDGGPDDEPDLHEPEARGIAGPWHRPAAPDARAAGGSGAAAAPTRSAADSRAVVPLDGSEQLPHAEGPGPTDAGPADDLEDGPAERGPDGAPSGAAEPADTLVARPRRRRAVVVTAVAALLVLGGMATVDAVTQRAETARLREAPGGLEPIGDAPQVVWELDADLASRAFGVVTGAIVLGGRDDVVGHDLDTGEEVWRVAVDDRTACGTAVPWFFTGQLTEQESLTCVRYPEALAAGPVSAPMTDPVLATVLAPDGSVVAEREVSPPDGPVAGADPAEQVRWLRPTPAVGGAVLWVGRSGPVPGGHGDVAVVDETTGAIRFSGEPADGAIALQDVATGEVRWSAAVPALLRDDTTYECAQWSTPSEDGTAEEVTVDLDQVVGYAADRTVHVQGCGVVASFSLDGVRLDAPADVGDTALPYGDGFLRDPSGGGALSGGFAGLYDASGEPLRSALLAADGSVTWEAPGLLIPPAATDGRSRLQFVQTGLTVEAYDADGTRLWEPDGAAGTPDRVLVATADVVLVSSRGDLVALDPDTGRARWTLEAATISEGFMSTAVMQAFTDGRTALLVVGASQAPRLVAVDLADGHVRWTAEGAPDAWSYLSLDGRLLSVGERSIALLQ